MREIKFRAWDKKEKIMYNWGVDIVSINTRSIKYRDEVSYQTYNFVSIPFKDIELMQYTGLKDKNGKEIYEGDIVTAIGRKPKYVVEMHAGNFSAEDKEMNWWWPINQLVDKEVIDNIYENPDLIKYGE